MAAGMKADVLVRLLGDTKHFDASMRRAQAQTLTLAQKMQMVGAKMKAVGRTMTLGLTVPIVAGFALATKAASDLEEVQNKVNVVFGKSAKDIHAWAASAATDLGMTRAAAAGSAATFGNLFTTMGLSDDMAVDMSADLVELAADLASFHNIDSETALEKLRSGLVGEVEPMRQLGVLLSETAVKEKAYAMGLAETGEVLTEQEKVQARYALILEQTETAQGDFARTSGDLANRMRILRAQVSDVAAQFGTVLLPIVTDLANFISKLAEKFAGLSPTMQRVVVIGLAVVAAIGPLLMILGQIVTVAPLVGAAFTAMTGPVGIVIVAVAALVAGIVLLYKKNETFRNFVNKAWATIKAAFWAVVPVIKAIVRVFGRMWSWVKDHQSLFVAAFRVMFAPILAAISSVKTLIGWLQQAYDYIKKLPGTLASGGGTAGGGKGTIGVRAEGGIVTRPELSLIGEAGAEAVVPLTNPARAAEVLAEAGLLGGQTIVQVFIGGEQIEPKVTKMQRVRSQRLARGYA